MFYLVNFLAILLQILLVAILVRVVLTFFPVDRSNGIVRVLDEITEPVLAPFRRVIPRIGMWDLSPLAAMLVIQFILANLHV